MDLCSNNSSLSSSLSVSISNTSSNNNLDFATTSTNISENTSKTNLIVNYLPQTMVREEFEALFASIGELQSCTLILDKFHIPSIENQQQLNLGYGFVDYVRSDHANEAIRLLNGLRIENKTLKVSFARPSSNTIKGANLFVCNMPKNWTSDDMTRVFSSCGVVITSRVLSKKAKSNESKGVGFVRFDRRSEAEAAVNTLNGKIMIENFGRPLIVKFANFPFSMTNINDFNVDYNNGQSFLMQKNSLIAPSSLITTTTMPAQSFPFIFTTLNAMANPWTSQNNNTTLLAINPFKWCISIRNLPHDTSEYRLWELFSLYGQLQHVNVTPKETCCHGRVVMTSYDEAARAINALNGFAYGGKILQVSFKYF